jgi:hypothetical protein
LKIAANIAIDLNDAHVIKIKGIEKAKTIKDVLDLQRTSRNRRIPSEASGRWSQGSDGCPGHRGWWPGNPRVISRSGVCETGRSFRRG